MNMYVSLQMVNVHVCVVDETEGQTIFVFGILCMFLGRMSAKIVILDLMAVGADAGDMV